MIQFPINVTPMGAVRMTQRSKWMDKSAQRYLAYKGVVGLTAKRHFPQPLEHPISITIAFYYPIPKSWSKRKKDDANDQGIMPTVKPDLDNCVKGIFDALNGIAWKDDNQVVDLRTMKRYAIEPMIVITINEMELEVSA